jgi:hypothetical protein
MKNLILTMALAVSALGTPALAGPYCKRPICAFLAPAPTPDLQQHKH